VAFERVFDFGNGRVDHHDIPQSNVSPMKAPKAGIEAST
jgi:hypothetical protein